MARVLVGCEKSQAVCCAFRELGIEAFSCDIQPAEKHPEWHLQEDVFVVLEREHWDLAVLFPPCFGGDTLITTINGPKPIQEIMVGDFVLTHNGRYRRVITTMNKISNHYRVLKSSNNIETITTDNHPFFVRRRLRRKDSDPSFINCSELDKSHFTGSIFATENIDCKYTDETLFLMGRYVADGHLRKCRYHGTGYEDMALSIGYDKFDFFKSRVTETKYSTSKERTVMKVHFCNRDFCQLFEQFGKGASNKTIPQWVVDLPQDRLKHFLEGYISGDGSISKNRLGCSTISKKLAIQIGNVLSKIYERPYSIFKAKERDIKIEGRNVHCKPLYSIYISITPGHKQNYFQNNSSWGRVLKNERINSEMKVYNLSIDEDNSYIANGVMVHNCTHLAVSGAQHFPEKIKDGRQQAGIDFFMRCINAPVERVAVENPIGIMSTIYREPDQIIQPYFFGDPYQKTTCLWLKNLPKLYHNGLPSLFGDPVTHVGKGEFFEWTDKKTGKKKKQPQWYADVFMKNGTDKDARSNMRSETFPGIARAIAAQWAEVLNNQ